MQTNKLHRTTFILLLILVGSINLQCRCHGGNPAPRTRQPVLEDYRIDLVTDIELKEILQRLKKGEEIDLNKATKHGDLPLHLAVNEDHQGDIVSFLIKKGANPNLQDDEGITALMLAVKGFKNQVIRALLDNGADPDLLNKQDNTALMEAIDDYYKEEIVSLFVKRGVNLDKQNSQGNTALILAVELGKEAYFKRLVKGGANINIQNKAKDTALHVAIRNARWSMVSDLLNNASINLLLENQDGHLPIHEELIKTDPNQDLLELLKEKTRDQIDESDATQRPDLLKKYLVDFDENKIKDPAVKKRFLVLKKKQKNL